MTRVIDETLKARLKDFSDFLEICDAEGQVLGYFHPAPIHDREIYDWARKEFTEEELEQARQDPVRYTTAEVLDHLRSL